MDAVKKNKSKNKQASSDKPMNQFLIDPQKTTTKNALVVLLHRIESVKSEVTGKVKSTDVAPGESP